jgi:hypothetical protein
MRYFLTALLLVAGCSSEAPRGRIPDTLAELVLAEGSHEITEVDFPHRFHNDPKASGQDLTCTFCHHTLADLPGSLPSPCVTCHPLEPVEGKPPDL